MCFKKIKSAISSLSRRVLPRLGEAGSKASGLAGGWKKYIIISGVLLAIILVGYGLFLWEGANKTISPAQAQIIVEKFVNDNLLPSTTKATIKGVTEEYGLYNITLVVNGKDYHSYLTKDGKKFFQSVLDIAEVEKQAQTQTNTANQPVATVAQKTAKPAVELYVFTYCPYGTQSEKGIIPAVKLLGNKIDFKIRQIGAMHGEHEKIEAQRQLCIDKQYPTKYIDYALAFALNSEIGACGSDAQCLEPLINAIYTKFGITKSKIDACMKTDGATLYSAEVANSQSKGIGSSPTLVINGSTIQANRDSASILKLICTGFTTVPAECNTVLSSTAPSAGFGQGTTSNTNSSAADCATQ